MKKRSQWARSGVECFWEALGRGFQEQWQLLKNENERGKLEFKEMFCAPYDEIKKFKQRCEVESIVAKLS